MTTIALNAAHASLNLGRVTFRLVKAASAFSLATLKDFNRCMDAAYRIPPRP